MEQGFAASPSVLETAAADASRMAHMPHRAPSTAEAASKSVAVGKDANAAAQPKLTAAQKKAADFQGVKSWALMPMNLEFFGMIGGALTGALGLQRVRTGLRMALKTPAHALRDTSIGEIFRLPANFVKAAANEADDVLEDVAKKAEASAEKAAEKGKAYKAKPVDATIRDWSKKLSERSESMLKDASKREAAFTQSKTVAGMRATIGNALDGFEASPIGKQLAGVADGLIHGRKGAAEAKHAATLEKARKALTGKRGGISGFFANVLDGIGKLFGKAPEQTEGMHHLSAIVGKLEHRSASQLKDMRNELGVLMESGAFKGEATHAANQLSKQLGKMVGSAHALEGYGSVAGGGLKGLGKVLFKAAGRMPILYPLLFIAGFAGIKAVTVTAHAESDEAQAAFKDLEAAIGGHDTAGFLQAVKADKKAASRGAGIKTGLQVANEAVEAATWGMMGGSGGGEAIMAAQAMPELFKTFVPDHPMLGAWVALQKDDGGEIKLSHDDRVKAALQLHAVEPVTAAHSGVYCRMAKYNAEEMVARGYTAKQIVAVLSDKAALTKLSSEVSAKLEQQAKAATANDNAVMSHAEPEVKAPEGLHAAGKPANLVAANDAQLYGKIAGHERAIA